MRSMVSRDRHGHEMAQVSSQQQTLWIHQSMREIISDFEVYETEGRTMDLTVAEGYKWRLETLSREMLALETSGELDQYGSDALECLLKSYSTVCAVVERLEIFEWSQPEANVSLVSNDSPSFEISYYLLNSFRGWLCWLEFWVSLSALSGGECLLFTCLFVKCTPLFLRMTWKRPLVISNLVTLTGVIA